MKHKENAIVYFEFVLHDVHFFNPSYLPHHKQIISQVDMRNQIAIRATAARNGYRNCCKANILFKI